MSLISLTVSNFITASWMLALLLLLFHCYIRVIITTFYPFLSSLLAISSLWLIPC